MKMLSFPLILIFTLPVLGQQLVKVDEFTAFVETYKDTAQFLPGAIITVHNDIRDGGNNTYVYRSGRFVRTKMRLSRELQHWSSFNWQDVDYPDLIDQNNLEDRTIRSFIPSRAKIKGTAVIPGTKKYIVLVCYSLPPKDQFASGNERDLYLLMLSRNPSPRVEGYKKLADIEAVEESYFGGLFVEQEPQGTFVLVYSTNGIGHISNAVTVLMLRPESPTAHARLVRDHTTDKAPHSMDRSVSK